MQTLDPIEILLPGAEEQTLRRARGVVQCLRLLVDDARPSRAAAIGVGLDQARSELAKQDRRRLADALADLLRHHLEALATPDTFLAWGEPALDHAAAWRVLDEFRDELSWLASVPEPGQSAAVVADRLVENHAALGGRTSAASLWKARVLRYRRGCRAAEAFLAGEIQVRERSGDREGTRALAACLVECLLDRGSVREARAWFQANAPLVEGDGRLRQLLSWCLLCCGDYSAAKTAIVGLPVWGGVLPTCLAELRAQRPEWLPCLAGRAAPVSDLATASPGSSEAVRERSEIGACVLGVFVLVRDGPVIPLWLDAAPAHRPGIGAWLADRDGACAIPGENEHELMVTARAVWARREGDRPIPGALGHETSLALALAPVLDDEDEVIGWLHVECEHHRLPSLSTLTAMAAAWRTEVLARSRGEAAAPRGNLPSESSEGGRRRVTQSLPECAAVFESLVVDLGIKTAQRRWWGFVMEGSEPQLVAMGGEGAGLTPRAAGRGRAVIRAAATRGRVGFDAPDPRLSLDENAGSGVVLPLIAGSSLSGLLAIESSRRRDFGEIDLGRYSKSAAERGLSLRTARFVAWHREQYGFEVWLDALRPGFRAFADHLLAAARSRAAVVLFGPAGAGKTILARWMHFESRGASGPLRFADCALVPGRKGLEEEIEKARGGSLVLDDLEELDPQGQEELLQFLERDAEGAADARVRIFATTRVGLMPAAGPSLLRDDLARRLDRLQMRVPALRERREDILPLVAGLARRFAREERLRVPEFSDEALALLWRQAWEGNVRELESFVYKLVLLGPNGSSSARAILEAERIHDIAARFSIRLARRLPSRHPVRSDLLAALRVTRKPGGKLNKTRAALYLGWDPDTLVARMQDAGLGEEVEAEEVWKVESNMAIEDPE